MMPRFLLTLFVAFLIAAPAPFAFAQGFFDTAPATQTPSPTEEGTPAREWTKQQLANIVIEATSPIFTLAEFKTEAAFEKAQQLLREDKQRRQKSLEETFTRDELYALHVFYTTFHGSNIGAKLSVGVKQQILQKIE